MLRRSRDGRPLRRTVASAPQYRPMTMNAPRPDPTERPQERGVVLGYTLIAVLAALTTAALRADAASKSVLMGVLLIAWGLMFLASYFFSHKTFFLRGLIWFCVTLSSPSTPKMAFFYFAVTTVMGAASILSGLGAF